MSPRVNVIPNTPVFTSGGLICVFFISHLSELSEHMQSKASTVLICWFSHLLQFWLILTEFLIVGHVSMLLDVPDDLRTPGAWSCWVLDIFILILELCSGKQVRCWGTVWSFQVLLLWFVRPGAMLRPRTYSPLVRQDVLCLPLGGHELHFHCGWREQIPSLSLFLWTFRTASVNFFCKGWYSKCFRCG